MIRNQEKINLFEQIVIRVKNVLNDINARTMIWDAELGQYNQGPNTDGSFLESEDICQLIARGLKFRDDTNEFHTFDRIDSNAFISSVILHMPISYQQDYIGLIEVYVPLNNTQEPLWKMVVQQCIQTAKLEFELEREKWNSALLQAALDGIPLGVCIQAQHECGNEIIYLNEEYRQLPQQAHLDYVNKSFCHMTPSYQPALSKFKIDASTKLLKKYIKNESEIYDEISLLTIEEQGSDVPYQLEIHADVTMNYNMRLKMQEAENELRTLFETVSDVILMKDVAGNLLSANKAAQSLFNIPDLDFVPKSYLIKKSQVYNTIRFDCEASDRMAWEEGSTISYYQPMQLANQETKVFDVRKTPIYDTDNKEFGIVVAARDISDKIEQDRILCESEQRYRSLVEYHPDAVVTLNRNGEFVAVNPAHKQMSGYVAQELIGQFFAPILDKELRDEGVAHFEYALRGKTCRFESVLLHKSGRKVNIDVTMVPIITKCGIDGVFCVTKDITLNKHTNEMIHKLAFTDELTQLPNRRSCDMYLSNLITNGFENNASFAVVLIDIDDFKELNDTFGKYTGESVIYRLSKQFQDVIQEDDYLSRWGSDEFIILIHQTENLSKQIENIRMAGSLPIIIDEKIFNITVTIGVSIFPNHGYTTDLLVSNAEVALYTGKKRGKDCIQYFSAELQEQYTRKLMLKSELHRAIKMKQIQVLYQPQVDSEGKILGVESLARWNHSLFGIISPAEFIPLAEETGLIHELGKHVLLKACEQIKQCGLDGMKHITVAVNVSAVQLTDRNFVDFVKNTISETCIPATQLELEITETVLAKGKSIEKTLCELRKLGISLSVDDFGTGYSSLQYLRDLPIQSLKIDRSFITPLPSSRAQSVVSGLISLAHNLGLKVVAEGVETEEQLSSLKSLRCDVFQGFLFSRPITTTELCHYKLSDEVSGMKEA